MPPRHAYWTILIDNAPTAFRAREQDELLPTLNQLKRTNANVEMKWFARGRLWATQELEREDFQRRKRATARPYVPREGGPAAGAPGGDRPRRDADQRGKDWRPGGAHKDPRDRFKKNQHKPVGEQAFSPAASGDRKPWTKPWRDKDKNKPVVGQASRPAGGDRKPWSGQTGVGEAFRPAGGGDRKPWTKPAGANRQPWRDKDKNKPVVRQAFRPAAVGDRKPWTKPWRDKGTNKPVVGQAPRPAGGDRKPWSGKAGVGQAFRPADGGDRRPWTKPAGANRQPWRDRPRPDTKRTDQRVATPPSKRSDEPAPPPSPEQIRTKPKPPERG